MTRLLEQIATLPPPTQPGYERGSTAALRVTHEAIALLRFGSAKAQTPSEEILLEPGAIASVQLSRSAQPRRRNWLARLVSSSGGEEETLLHAELRARRVHRVRLTAVCDEPDLLEGVPHLPLEGDIFGLALVRDAILTALAFGGRLARFDPASAAPPERRSPSSPAMDVSTRLGEAARPLGDPDALLDLIHLEPSAGRWELILRHLEAMDDDAFQRHASRLSIALEGWPDELRVASPVWRERLASGHPEPRLRLTRVVDLSGRHLEELGARRVASVHQLTYVRTLDLSYADIGDAGAQALADSPHLGNLTHLNLYGNTIGALGARTLRQSPHLTGLTQLELGGNPCQYDAHDVEAEAQSTREERIREAARGLPSEGAWALINRELRALPDDEAGLLAEALEEPLERWPDSLRVLPSERAQGGALDPPCRLARRLELREIDGLRPDALDALARSPHLTRITQVTICGCDLTAEGLRALFGSPTAQRRFDGLLSLDLGSNALGDAGVAALLDVAPLERLIELTLSRNRIGDAGATAIASHPELGALRRLDLSSNDIGGAGVAALKRSAILSEQARIALVGNPVLERRGFDFTSIGRRDLPVDAGPSSNFMAELDFDHPERADASPHDPELAEQSARFRDALASLISGHPERSAMATRPFSLDAALAAAAGPPSRHRWRSLCAVLERIDDARLRPHTSALEEALHAWPAGERVTPCRWLPEPPARRLSHLQLCRSLALGGMHVGDDTARAIAAQPGLSQICHVELSANNLTDAGLIALLESPHLGRITYLDLSFNALGPESARRIAEATHLTELSHLDLRANHIGREGVLLLARSPGLQRLEFLSVSGNEDTHAPDPTPSREREIEVLLAAPPSTHGWERLCALLGEPPEPRAELLEAIEQALERGWPDGLRRAPHGWTQRLLAGDPTPHLGLARVLDLSSAMLDDDELLELLERAELHHIRELDLSFNALTDAAVPALTRWASSLRRLDLSFNAMTHTGIAPLEGRVALLERRGLLA